MATEKITLYDSEKDTLIELYVSPLDAKRAITDTAFAADLIKNVTNPADNPDDMTCEEAPESEGVLCRWTPPCVLLLLETYKSMEKTLLSGKCSQKQIWEEVAKELRKNGYNATGAQCSSKLRSLKKTYKSIKTHKSENERNWQFLEIMEEIYARKAWRKPVVPASSTSLQTRKVKDSDSGCSNQLTIATLMQKRLKQREEHEQNRMKRHKEQMQMDEKLLKVLEKLSNK